MAFAVLFIGWRRFRHSFCMRAKEYIDGHCHRMALEEAGVGVAPGLTLTTIAASIGFLAFVPTDYKGTPSSWASSRRSVCSSLWEPASASFPPIWSGAHRASPTNASSALSVSHWNVS